MPEVPLVLEDDRFNENVRSAKRGGTAGRSGTTVEHLHPLLDHPKDLRLFNEVAERLARGQVPDAIQAAIKDGKGDGGVRHRCLRCCRAFGRPHNVPTVDRCGAEGNRSFSVRHGHESGLRVHSTRVARRYRDEPDGHDSVS